MEWTEEEIRKLTGSVTEEEITNILSFQVDLDSSPGVDGITYRFIKIFWSFDAYKKLYLLFLNNSRREKNLGCSQNLGMMVVKNKKSQSIHYDKKRKLTKVNKDLNLGHGKVWTNRMRDIVLPKILPKTQFNCQQDINIIDEIMEIREVNQHLLGDRKEMDGFRFWNGGYWKQHLAGRRYHISAIYVVDLKRFRQLAAGDRLRGQYQGRVRRILPLTERWLA